jgi:hypothetical protein
VQFQLVQHNEKELEVNLATTKDFDEAARASVITGLQDRIGKVALKLNIVDEIPRDARTGKIKCIVNHTKRK